MTLRQCVRLSQRSLLLSQRSLFLSPHTIHTIPCLRIQQVRKFYCSHVKCSPTEDTNATIKRVQSNEKPAQSNEKPVQSLEKPVQSNEKPVQSLEKPVQTLEKPVQTLEKPVQSNEDSDEQQSRKTKLLKQRWNSWSKTKKVFVCLGGGVFLTFYALFVTYHYLRNKAIKENDRIMRTEGRSYGKIAIGGPFDLIDTDGNSVSNETLKGKWILLYFGFTMCPDVCPEQMEMMGELVDIAQEKLGLSITPVMITIDCDRDTPEMIKEYLEDFHPKFIGLTGSEEQITAPCLSYRVYRSKGQPLDDSNDYILDHTVTQYVLNPKGDTVGFFLRNRELPERVDILEKLVNEYKKQNPSED